VKLRGKRTFYRPHFPGGRPAFDHDNTIEQLHTHSDFSFLSSRPRKGQVNLELVWKEQRTVTDTDYTCIRKIFSFVRTKGEAVFFLPERRSLLGSLKTAHGRGRPRLTRLNQEETTENTGTPVTTAKCRIPGSIEEERAE